jgi:hypothetical protein
VSPTIKGLKRLRIPKLQDHSGPRHPIRAFAVNQMADDIEGAPRVLAFIPERPRFRQVPQKGIERCGGASKKRYGALQVMSHRVPQFPGGDFIETPIVSVLRPRRLQRVRSTATPGCGGETAQAGVPVLLLQPILANGRRAEKGL